MTEAVRDNNRVAVALGTSNADGKTPLPFFVDASNRLVVSNGTTGTDMSGDDATRDNNGYPVALGVSSVDGKTPVPIYINSISGALLVKST